MLEIFTFNFILLISIYAGLWKGGGPERLCALVFIFMMIFQLFGTFLFGYRYYNVDAVSLFVDVLAFVAITFIALQANRIWPLWTAAMQLLSCAAHFGRQAMFEVEPLVYATLKSGGTFLAILSLLFGTVHLVLHTRRHGSKPGWVASFRPPRWMPQSLAA